MAPLAAGTRANRWRAWASSIASRHTARGGPLARRRGAISLPLAHRPSSLLVIAPKVALRLSLAFHAEAARDASAYAGVTRGETMTLPSPWRAMREADVAAAEPRSPWAMRERVRTIESRSAVERVMRRLHQRIDAQITRAVTTRVAARTDRVETRPASARRDLVLATPAAVAANTRAATAPEVAPPSLSMQARMPALPWNGRDTTPPINLDRLADQVLQQLDRRVDAWRERMGRS